MPILATWFAPPSFIAELPLIPTPLGGSLLVPHQNVICAMFCTVQRNISLTQPNFNLHQQHIDFESNPNQPNPHHTFSNPNPTNQNHSQPTKFAITSRQHGLLKPLPGRQDRFPKPTEAIVVLQERLETGIRCPTCHASGKEVWVLPGKECGYCGTPCG
ncbi:uncharacterized protein CLUP02_08648 [Colletotrichum lupini]|uniref:Uncharacterized protein n=1 Tax=Colletotrichum lupini TaxID=145971 RepID=A0A9Q8SU89_9PEZI|nr:uncharacterized protein CLUP02_08648 [Colletotrichum lupini]UQC83155.1 hypothetical protein CLUP02_08648 [Colletotrichum lupini]